MFDNIATLLLVNPWGQRLCWAALFMVSLLCLSTLIHAPLTWYSDIKLVNSSSNIVIDIPVSRHQGPDLIQEIPNWHLFGNAAKVNDMSVLPVTSLQLRLVGLVQSIPENQSSVIISHAGQPGKVYLIGDMLPMGVKVNAIIEDGVILENAGRLEKLPLQRQTLSFQGMPKKLLRED